MSSSSSRSGALPPRQAQGRVRRYPNAPPAPRSRQPDQPPRYPDAGPEPPSYEEDRQDRLAQIDSKIDAVGEKKLEQIEATYEGETKKTLDELREQIKDLNKVLPDIFQRPDETDRDHIRRLKHKNLTIEDYRQSITT